MTPAQMDAVVRSYARCGHNETVRRGDRAVVRYAQAERQCAPWFLQRQNGQWTLDLVATQSAIHFNHRNQWRFVDPRGHAYAFAFDDWSFDSHGFPIADR